MFKGALF